MKHYMSEDIERIQRQIVSHVEYTLAKTRFDFKISHAYQATAISVLERLLERLNDTNETGFDEKASYKHLISAEFMLGR
jgi:glycogen phosphorylase